MSAADLTRYTVTTAYHRTPAPCDLCARVAPLFRTPDALVCADCHQWDAEDAARAVAALPAPPCPDCDPDAYAARWGGEDR